MAAADEVGAPIILQASAGARKYAGDPFIKHLIQAACEAFPHIPLVMHQDCGTSLKVCAGAIDLGFGSLMEDGKTRRVQVQPQAHGRHPGRQLREGNPPAHSQHAFGDARLVFGAARAAGHHQPVRRSGRTRAITCGEPMGSLGGTNMLKICRVF